MRLGIDFGTTNSSAAIYEGEGERLTPIPVDPRAENPTIMPSLLYIDRHGAVETGTAAADAYLQHETGRPILWRQRQAGEIATTVASWENEPIEFWQQVNVYVDDAANGRLLQSIKATLFRRRYEGTQIFERFYTIEHLIAMVLRVLKGAAERTVNGACDDLLLGRPVHFSRNPLADSRAESILLKAAFMAGFRDVRLQPEPVGVVHLLHRQTRERQTGLVFDFGGGTLDLTVAQFGGKSAPEVLATAGVVVGGDDFNRRLMRTLLPHFSAHDEGCVPGEMADKLLAWQTMPELSRPAALHTLRELAKKHPSQRQQLNTLETLVTCNLGFSLFAEVERVKKQLSTQEAVTLNFDYEDDGAGSIHIRETITRKRFERLISSELSEVAEGIDTVMARSGLRAEDIHLVLRTGGSSLIPACIDLLVERFGADKLHPIDPLTSVVGGIAVAAHDLTPVNVISDSLISNIQSASGREYRVDRIRIGVACYTDWPFEVSRVPAALVDLSMIQTANLDRESDAPDTLRFTLTRPARVYVAFDASIVRLPMWLRDYSFTPIHLEIEDEFANIKHTMRLYTRDTPAGEVTLGAPCEDSTEMPNVHYFVVVGAALRPLQ